MTNNFKNIFNPISKRICYNQKRKIKMKNLSSIVDLNLEEKHHKKNSKICGMMFTVCDVMLMKGLTLDGTRCKYFRHKKEIIFSNEWHF